MSVGRAIWSDTPPIALYDKVKKESMQEEHRKYHPHITTISVIHQGFLHLRKRKLEDVYVTYSANSVTFGYVQLPMFPYLKIDIMRSGY